ncbi:FAD-binding oxidoreductase (plasmid) [Comamonadaceae bacterium OTU4NAUVB1]|nr:FAD-binding oxidoreductase [Comamonadaceae bacterium OTU4NAUVB1]
MQFDIVIVGAGIAGSSLAWQLSRHARVALLEMEAQPGYHATGRSAALFMETYGTPMIRALTRASRAFYENPPEGFTEHPILSPRGVMHVAKHGQERELEDALAFALASSPNVVLLSTSQVVERCSVLRADLICGAVYEADAMDIDVHALHQGYLRGFRGNGGQLLSGATLSSAAFGSGQWTITLADGRGLSAGKLVNAAGAWADVVASRCGVPPVGLQPKRRTAFTFEPPADVDIARWPAIVGVDETYYFKPDAGQLLGSPANADPVDPQDIQPEELDVATGIHFIEEVTTLQIRRPRHVWAGLRSFVADGDLVIGADDRCPAFVWAAAQGGYGIQTASAAAALAAASVLGQDVPQHLAAHGVVAEALLPRRLR